MSSHRLPVRAARPQLGDERTAPVSSASTLPARARKGALGVLVVAGAATMLAACGAPWTAPASTIREPTTTTPALTPVPGGGGSLTVVNPLAYQTQSPGRAVPSRNNSANSGQVSGQANHNDY